MPPIRLDKLLADTGKWSRKEAKELIRHGRVLIDGVPARSAEEKYNPEGLDLTVDGQPVLHQTYTYLMLNKPADLLSATRDKGQKTVLSLLSPELQRRELFPVGRLDKDSTGLLLLTNHGQLAHRLLSPRHHVDKVYLVHTDGQINDQDCRVFAEGLTFESGEVCMPAFLCPVPDRPGWCTVTLQEGKFHQVKRMLAARGKPVLSLHRLSMGNLQLDNTLAPGEYRPLTREELENLLHLAGL